MARILYGTPDLGPLTGPLKDLVVACLAGQPADRPDAEQVLSALLDRASGRPSPSMPGLSAPLGRTDAEGAGHGHSDRRGGGQARRDIPRQVGSFPWKCACRSRRGCGGAPICTVPAVSLPRAAQAAWSFWRSTR